jgi:hypothetical protein
MPKALVNPVPVPQKDYLPSEGPFREVNKDANPFEDANVKIEPMRRGRPAKSAHGSQELAMAATTNKIPIFDDNFGQKMNNLNLNNDAFGIVNHFGSTPTANNPTPALGLQMNSTTPQSQFFQLGNQPSNTLTSPPSVGYHSMPLSTQGMNSSNFNPMSMQPALMNYTTQPGFTQQPLSMQKIPSYGSQTSQHSHTLNPRLSQGSFQSVSPTNTIPFTPQEVFSNAQWPNTDPTPPPKPPRVNRNTQQSASHLQSPNHPAQLEVPNWTTPVTPTTPSPGSTSSTSRGDAFVSKMVDKFNKAP